MKVEPTQPPSEFTEPNQQRSYLRLSAISANRKHFTQASWLSKLFYFYGSYLINNVRQNDNTMKEAFLEDMTLNRNETVEEVKLFKDTMEYYSKEVQQGRQLSYYGIIWRSLFKMYKKELAYCVILNFFAEVLAIFYTFFIRNIILFIYDDTREYWHGIYLVGVFGVAAFLSTLLRNYYYFYSYRIAIKLRKTLVLAAYEKIIKLSMYSMFKIKSGRIINFISSELFSIERGLTLVPLIISSPLINIAGFIFIGDSVGWVFALSTFLLWLVVYITQYCVSRWQYGSKLDESQVVQTRLQLINEVLKFIKTIKCYAWEKLYISKLLKNRQDYNDLSYYQRIYVGFINSFIYNAGFFGVLIIFYTKWKLGEDLDQGATMAITSMLFYIFSTVNSLAFDGMNNAQSLWAILERYSKIMELEENDLKRDDENSKEQTMIECKDCSFGWAVMQKELGILSASQVINPNDVKVTIIKNLTMSLKSNDLLLVMGPSGSGKTTFLLSMLQETHLIQGQFSIKGTYAYVSQDPFILDGTILDNILFGEEYDEDKLNKVLKVCQLKSDLKHFPNDLETDIGEKGFTLSWGQKVKISLARAVYADADIYLIDDPLSQVDMKVSNKIFNECIKEYLKDKLRILVTHRLAYLKTAEKIIYMEKGRDCCMSSYDKLRMKGLTVGIGKLTSEYNSMQRKRASMAQSSKIAQSVNLPSNKSISIKNSKDLKYVESDLTQRDIKPIIEDKQEDVTRSQIKIEEVDESKSSSSEYNFSVSIQSSSSNNDSDDSEDFYIEKEDEIKAKITWKDYLNLNRFAKRKFGIVIFIFLAAIYVGLQLLINYYLSQWTSSEEEYVRAFYPQILLILIICFCLALFGREMSILYVKLGVNFNLHKEMIRNILTSKLTFFQNNPDGRIFTRFSKDSVIVDTMLFPVLVTILSGLLRGAFVVVTVAILNYYTLIAFFVSALLMAIYLKRASIVLKETNRLESNLRTPTHDAFIQLVGGIINFRAYGRRKMFLQKFITNLEEGANAQFCYEITNRWLGLRLDFITLIFSVGTAAFCVGSRNTTDKSDLAYIMTAITDIIPFISYSLRQYLDLSRYMVAAQRMMNYTKLDVEDNLILPEDKNLKDWPKEGSIEFKNVSFRYRDSQALALKEVTFKIDSTEEVGIVGRSGSGKSTIIACLFKLDHFHQGIISIDGVPTSDVGSIKLRQSIGYLPQTPFLFQGTLRENLDPFGEFTDEQIVKVLKELEIFQTIEKLPKQLDTVIKEISTEFSFGQKQLLCLSRVLLQNKKIIVLDEATANMDISTDFKVQMRLRELTQDKTVIVIASRIPSIITTDKIVVLKHGKIVEQGIPFKLLTTNDNDRKITKTNSQFAVLTNETGKEGCQAMFRLAKKKYGLLQQK